MARGGECCQGVQAVVGTKERPAHPAHRAAGKRDVEGAGRVRLACVPASGDAEGVDWGPAAHGEYSLHALVGTVGDDFSGFRHGSHEVMELPLDRYQIVEDVGMIKLDVIQYCGAGPVMDEFRALV